MLNILCKPCKKSTNICSDTKYFILGNVGMNYIGRQSQQSSFEIDRHSIYEYEVIDEIRSSASKLIGDWSGATASRRPATVLPRLRRRACIPCAPTEGLGRTSRAASPPLAPPLCRDAPRRSHGRWLAAAAGGKPSIYR